MSREVKMQTASAGCQPHRGGQQGHDRTRRVLARGSAPKGTEARVRLQKTDPLKIARGWQSVSCTAVASLLCTWAESPT